MTEPNPAAVRPPAQVSTPAGQPRPVRRQGLPAWAWFALIALLILGVPAVACGAFGFSLALAAQRPAQPAAIGPAVGVIDVEGQIVAGESAPFGTGVAASETIVELIERAGDMSSIEAVVLRVNSPGGSVVASDEIYQALRNLDKPVVVTMGEYGASGGYYISAGADFIYVTPYTLTGSIGVISQFFNAEELLDDLGVEVETITSGESKDFGNFAREMTEEERAYWEDLTTQIYEGFVAIVAEERGLPIDDVRAIADGRIILGQDAVELGLADGIGYFDDAVARAAELGGIEGEPRTVELTPDATFFDAFWGLQSRPSSADVLDLLLRDLSPPAVQFR